MLKINWSWLSSYKKSIAKNAVSKLNWNVNKRIRVVKKQNLTKKAFEIILSLNIKGWEQRINLLKKFELVTIESQATERCIGRIKKWQFRKKCETNWTQIWVTKFEAMQTKKRFNLLVVRSYFTIIR